MKKTLITVALVSTLAGAYCEYGRKVSESYITGGKLTVYDFGQGRVLSFRFEPFEMSPYSIRFDFSRHQVCQD